MQHMLEQFQQQNQQANMEDDAPTNLGQMAIQALLAETAMAAQRQQQSSRESRQSELRQGAYMRFGEQMMQQHQQPQPRMARLPRASLFDPAPMMYMAAQPQQAQALVPFSMAPAQPVPAAAAAMAFQQFQQFQQYQAAMQGGGFNPFQ